MRSNTWTHLAATYDGAIQHLYVNGTEVGCRAQSGTLAVSANPLRIGGNTVRSEYFQRLINELRIYKRAISKPEIPAVAQSAQGGRACQHLRAPRSLWHEATTPSVAATPDASAKELGAQLRSDVVGRVTGVRLHKGSRNTSSHAGPLGSSSGQLLAKATFTNESASGWHQVSFASPVPIQANTNYVVSYYAPAGRNAYDLNYFTSSFTKGLLRVLASSEAGGNGVFRYGRGGGFTSSYRSANFGVDAVFTTP